MWPHTTCCSSRATLYTWCCFTTGCLQTTGGTAPSLLPTSCRETYRSYRSSWPTFPSLHTKVLTTSKLAVKKINLTHSLFFKTTAYTGITSPPISSTDILTCSLCGLTQNNFGLSVIIKICHYIHRMEVVKVEMDGIRMYAPKYPKAFLRQIPSHFIPCNHSRSHSFHSKYGKDKSSDAITFRKKAIKVLKQAKKVLDELGMPFWMSSGTCLGKWSYFSLTGALKRHTLSYAMSLISTSVRFCYYMKKS